VLAGVQVQQLCDKASAEVAEGQGVRIANFLCPGNYAISGGLDGCAVVEKIAKPDFKVTTSSWPSTFCLEQDSMQQTRVNDNTHVALLDDTEAGPAMQNRFDGVP
jgi:hypothetical protein